MFIWFCIRWAFEKLHRVICRFKLVNVFLEFWHTDAFTATDGQKALGWAELASLPDTCKLAMDFICNVLLFSVDIWLWHFLESGWLGRVMVLGSFQCRGALLLWHMVGQGPAVLTAGVGRVGFFHILHLPFLMPHLLGDGWTFWNIVVLAVITQR